MLLTPRRGSVHLAKIRVAEPQSGAKYEEKFVVICHSLSSLWSNWLSNRYFSGKQLILSIINDILNLAIEAQYYILGENGEFRCIRYVP